MNISGIDEFVIWKTASEELAPLIQDIATAIEAEKDKER